MTSRGVGPNNYLELIRRFTDECWNEGNVAMVPELVAADCPHHDPVFPRMAPGPASVRLQIERVRRAFPDLKFTILDAVGEDNVVKVLWSATATQAAEFLGILSTKKSASITGTSTYRIVGGKIAENWVQWDVMSLMAQLVGPTTARQEVQHWRRAG